MHWAAMTTPSKQIQVNYRFAPDGFGDSLRLLQSLTQNNKGLHCKPIFFVKLLLTLMCCAGSPIFCVSGAANLVKLLQLESLRLAETSRRFSVSRSCLIRFPAVRSTHDKATCISASFHCYQMSCFLLSFSSFFLSLCLLHYLSLHKEPLLSY